MEILKTNNDSIIKFSLDELLVMANSLNEVCNGIHVRNFENVIGTSESKVEELLRVIGELYESTLKKNNVNENFGTLEMTKTEISILSNVLIEVINQIEPWEYHSRIGMDVTDGIQLKDSLLRLLKELNDECDRKGSEKH